MSEPTTKKQDKKLNAVTTQLINATVRHVVQLIIDDAEIRQHLNDVLMRESGGTILRVMENTLTVDEGLQMIRAVLEIDKETGKA